VGVVVRVNVEEGDGAVVDVGGEVSEGIGVLVTTLGTYNLSPAIITVLVKQLAFCKSETLTLKV
jgi:hypothetical protein